eukprot:11715589-Alexandrium_andersonii.AAC.1
MRSEWLRALELAVAKHSGSTLRRELGASLGHAWIWKCGGLPEKVRACMESGAGFSWMMFPRDVPRVGLDIPEQTFAVDDLRAQARGGEGGDGPELASESDESEDEEHASAQSGKRFTANQMFLFMELAGCLKPTATLAKVIGL